MNNITKNKRGFTLIETLVGVSIFVIIAVALTLFSRNVWFYNSVIGTTLESVNAGRVALKTMAAEIRTASSGSNGAYPIYQDNSASFTNSTSFTFYSDIYDDGLKEKVRYFLNGTNLQRGVIKPIMTDTPPSYPAGNEVITTLASNVTNASLFSYYDKNYDGTTAALSSPIDILAIRLVKISITIEKDPNRSPTPIVLSTQVTMRNIKDNL